ncbi:MAG TPA: restriction endonuclease subunit S [Candidatus Sulfotelmatobacter sp.]|nr:restriction endonuclease subunit S [Candidatus Sulfotelmatobacter sp.]
MSESWVAEAVRSVATVILSGVDKHIVAGEIPTNLCNYLDVYRNRRLTKGMSFAGGTATQDEIARFSLKKGDVLITKDSETPDDIGIPALVVDSLPNTICGYHLAILRPCNRLDPRFLLHYLQSDAAKRHFLRMANGVTRFGLGAKAIASLSIPVPPLDEQTDIARVLDAVDSALDSTRIAVNRARIARNSLLADLLTHGIDNDGKVRRQDSSQFVRTAVGTVPASWTLSTVGSEFELQNGFTLNEGRQARFRKRRYLRVANVQRDSLSLADIYELEASDSEFAPRVLAEDDLLVVEGHADRMQIGRCARVTREAVGMTFQNHLFRLRSMGRAVPAFGCLWLNSQYAQRFWNAHCATSSGLNTINQRTLRKLIFPVPSTEEQCEIVKLVAAQRMHLDALAKQFQCLESLKRSLVRDLMTGRVRLSDQARMVAS